MALKLALLGTIFLLSTLLSNIYALADDLIDTTSTNVDDSSNNNNNGGIVLNYPSSAAGIYLHPGSIHHPAHQPGVQELSQKLDTVILLVENAFGKTAERIERVEQKLTRFEQLVGDLDQKLQDYKIDHANLQLLTDRMQKLYNVHTETYRICKDAVVTKNQPSRPFFSGLGRSSHSSDTSSASASSSSDPIVVENGGSDASENGKSPARSEEHDYMLFVIAAATNYTLEKYVTLLERKMAEEFNVFNFIMKEKFEATEETLGKVSRTSKHLLDSHDQLTSGLLAIKETVEDEQTVLESLDVKVGKIQLQNEKDMQQKQEARSAGAPNGACDSNNYKNSTQVLDAGIRELFEEYMRKLIESKQSNEILNDSASATQEKRERMGKNSLHTDQTQPRSVSGDQPRVPAPPPPQPPPTKKPIQFVTISVSDLPQPDPHDNDDHDHDHKEDDNMVVDHKGLAKPEFKPVKHTNFPRMTCTTKSSAAYPKSCAEIRENGATCDGVYVTIVQKFALKHVYCDMRHMQGGWTVLLRRGRFSNTKQITFDHTFSAYRSGFGDMHLGEFFLGLDNIYQLTKSDGPYDLQIDLEDTTGEYISFQYSGFRIGNLQNDFRFYIDQIKDHDQAHHTVSVAQYRQLASVLLAHNGTQFLTVDRVRKLQGSKSNGPPDQHMAFVGECAQLYQSGWWYGNALPFGVSKQDACKVANGFQLMAQMEYHKKGSGDRSHGKTAHGHYHHQAPLAQHGSPASHLFMYWSKWTNADGTPRVLRHVLMKIRPANFALKK